MKTSIIAAVGRRGAIGAGGDLAFHISPDLRHFKAVTMGKPVIMGRKTFESLPGGALPGRLNIVISRDPHYTAPGVTAVSSLTDAIAAAETSGASEAMIIGGAQIYAQAMPIADALILTEIDAERPDADTFFPAIGPEWTLSDDSAGKDEWTVDPKTSLPYRFVCYSRK